MAAGASPGTVWGKASSSVVMYKKFFGLQVNPFNPNPDPRFLFLTGATREALAGLAYGIRNRKGFLLLTGEVGTGKTTLLNRLLEWLAEERIATAFVFNSRLNENEFFDFILNDFGITCPSTDKSQRLLKLNEWLLDQFRERRTAVLIVDEAQNLSPDVLEEVRLLTNMETTREKLLQIVLSGQPELEEKLRDPALRQLKQRITIRCNTCPLSREEMQSCQREDQDRGRKRHAGFFTGGGGRRLQELARNSANRKPFVRTLAHQRVRRPGPAGSGTHCGRDRARIRIAEGRLAVETQRGGRRKFLRVDRGGDPQPASAPGADGQSENDGRVRFWR